MMWRSIVLTAALPAFLLVACGGKEDPPPASSSQGKEASCEEFCEDVKDCDGVDASDCVTSCTENKTTSRAGQEAFSSCFNASLCESQGQGESEEQADLLLALACLPSQLSDLELSKSQKDYCEKTAPAFNACAKAEPTALPFGDCEEVIGAVSDETLKAFNECTEKECGSLELCVTGALLQSVDLGAISNLDGENVSPEALTSLLTIAILASQLGSTEATGGFDFGELIGGETDTTPDPDMMGNAGAGND